MLVLLGTGYRGKTKLQDFGMILHKKVYNITRFFNLVLNSEKSINPHFYDCFVLETISKITQVFVLFCSEI